MQLFIQLWLWGCSALVLILATLPIAAMTQFHMWFLWNVKYWCTCRSAHTPVTVGVGSFGVLQQYTHMGFAVGAPDVWIIHSL